MALNFTLKVTTLRMTSIYGYVIMNLLKYIFFRQRREGKKK